VPVFHEVPAPTMEELQASSRASCGYSLARVSHHRARYDLPRQSGRGSRAFGMQIDGEVVAIQPDGRISFNALQHSRTRAHLQFYVFDALIYLRTQRARAAAGEAPRAGYGHSR
jgi:hypothetical protein